MKKNSITPLSLKETLAVHGGAEKKAWKHQIGEAVAEALGLLTFFGLVALVARYFPKK
jgi:hypothetical protein